jgi:hypothetical protein
MVALVCPWARRAVTSTTSRSMPDSLRAVPLRRGRSPTFDTAAPRYERVPLKKLFAGLSAFESAMPLKESASPVSESSPS